MFGLMANGYIGAEDMFGKMVIGRSPVRITDGRTGTGNIEEVDGFGCLVVGKDSNPLPIYCFFIFPLMRGILIPPDFFSA